MILDGINGPADLKQLTLPHLKQLADEIRSRIVATVASPEATWLPAWGQWRSPSHCTESLTARAIR